MIGGKTLLLGIGNELLSDEGVGIHALRALASRYDMPQDIVILDGGTTGMELLPQLEGLDLLIVIDAVRAGQAPASIVRLDGDRVPAYFKTKLSPHQVGLSDLLAALAFKGTAPGRVLLIGVQPVTLALGMELSPEVEARMDEVLNLVVTELASSGHPVKMRN